MIKVTPGRLFKGIAVVAIGVALIYMFKSKPLAPQSTGMQEFFSDDDGATWFADDGTKVTPFNHGKKEAVLAHVYRCPNGENFVGYLEKYNPATKARLESGNGSAGMNAATNSTADSVMVKKPRGGIWVGEHDPAAEAIRQVSCPNGGKDFVVVVPDGT